MRHVYIFTACVVLVFCFFFCLVALFLGGYILTKTLLYSDPAAGCPSLMCVIWLVGDAQLPMQGIQGQYPSKTYLETKRRPIYISTL